MLLRNENVINFTAKPVSHDMYHMSNHFRDKTPALFFPRFVSVWPAPEVVDGIFEVCPSLNKL